MARKNTTAKQIETAKSLSASFTSPPTPIRNLDNVSYQINIHTTDSHGTFQCQVSNDYNDAEISNLSANAGTWVPLTLAGGIPFAAGSDDQIVINLTQLSFNAIRVAYIASVAGTGTCDMFVLSKQLGG